ncbi:hypothetical protein TNCV_418081 [Trichonephila clavipes]|nr:hypothetical protein TNCV_418081 [Trichonephila clavipes]
MKTKIRASCTCEIMNIGHRHLISIPHNSRRDSFKDMKVCASIQSDVCPVHQASAIVMVDFSDTGWQIVGLWFFPYESTTRVYRENHEPCSGYGLKLLATGSCMLNNDTCCPILNNYGLLML